MFVYLNMYEPHGFIYFPFELYSLPWNEVFIAQLKDYDSLWGPIKNIGQDALFST